MKLLLIGLLALGTISSFAQVNDCSVKVAKNTDPEIITALSNAGFRPEFERRADYIVYCHNAETQFCLSSNTSKKPKQRRVGHDVVDVGLFIVTFGFWEGHDLLTSWKQEAKLGLNILEARERKPGPVRASLASNVEITFKSKLGGENPKAKNLNEAISDLANQIESKWDCNNGEISLR